ncbi:MAG: Gfo/Idh/MocA family oxidoreductase [Dermatophilaceae bacterium]|nr:Gfo/Idh/MocA family oxidoreductase [Dermatophilaceae bacterium]NUO90428.1 Gfo/Idh/MocA family oxidoreductase [Dermatophilaceae bacterium]NUR17841.1 Gfo/Idh/MocA family oxidoreductase [Dermatophilaceae bacterium]
MSTPSTPTLGVGMIGYAFMGRAHSQAWRNVRSYFDAPATPRLVAVAGRNESAARDTADRFGWAGVETDWRRLLERDDIDIIDICTPGDTHAEIAVAALEAGKHVLCEKPLANSVGEAEAMARAAEAARGRGVRSMVGFTYRRVPAIAYARRLVEEGRLGRILHVRGAYLQDWLVDPESPLTWRLQKERAGSGALGDVGAHIVDLAQFVTGETLTGASALTETFVRERPVADPASVGTGGISATAASNGAATTGPVTVDDAAVFVSRLTGGALATFEATRFANGRKNAIRLEINGTRGSVAFDFEDMNVLHVFDGSAPSRDAGFTRVLVTEASHPYVAAWWPPGHVLGYEHGFTHQAVDLLTAIAEGTDPRPTFSDGLQVQRILSAVEASAERSGSWTPVDGARALAPAPS